jgi:hypothetical protein
MNRTRGEKRRDLVEHNGAAADVLRRNGVRDVDDARVRVDRQDDALYCCDVGAALAKVGGERDEGEIAQ